MTVVVTRLQPRQSVIDGLRYIPGVTSKSDILTFAPHANVGAPPDDDKDIRWCFVGEDPLSPLSAAGDAVTAGDWIVKYEERRYGVLTHERLIERFDVVGRAEV